MLNIDPRHLKQFYEIVRTGSYTQAASNLSLTQPALTRNMLLLEERLNVKLMTRSRKGITPTPIGEKILQEASILRIVENRIVNIVKDQQNGFQDELRIGCLTSMNMYFLPKIIVEYSKENPYVRLDVRQGHTQDLIHFLQNNDIDIAIGSEEIAHTVKHSQFIKLFPNPLILIGPKNLAYKGKEKISIAELQNQKWILFRSETAIRKQSDNYLAELGLKPFIQAMELPSNMIVEMLKSGEYFSIVPEYLFNHSNLKQNMTLLSKQNTSKNYDYGVILRNDYYNRKATENFIQKLSSTPIS